MSGLSWCHRYLLCLIPLALFSFYTCRWNWKKQSLQQFGWIEQRPTGCRVCSPQHVLIPAGHMLFVRGRHNLTHCLAQHCRELTQNKLALGNRTAWLGRGITSRTGHKITGKPVTIITSSKITKSKHKVTVSCTESSLTFFTEHTATPF